MNTEKQLIDSMQDLFAQSEAEVGAEVRARLARSRQRAVSAALPATHQWVQGLTGLATAAGVAMLVVSLWSRAPQVEQAVAAALPKADISLLAGTENLEFYSNLEFIAWLDTEG